MVFSRGAGRAGAEPAGAVRVRDARPTICRRGCSSSTSAAAASGWSWTRRASSCRSIRRRFSRPAAALTGLSGRYLEGVANIGDRLILVLNLAEALTFERSRCWKRTHKRQSWQPAKRTAAHSRLAPHSTRSLVLVAGRAGRRRPPARSRASPRRSPKGADAQLRALDDALGRRQRDGRVAEGDRRPGRVGRGLGRGAGVVGQRDGRVDRAGDGQHHQPGRLGRRDRPPRSRRAPRRSSTSPATTQEMATAAQQVTASISEMAGSVQVGQPRHRVADRVGQRDRRRDRGDDASRSRRCRATPTTWPRPPKRPRRRSTRWRRRSRKSAR